jgi:alpha-ribazole phosphatase
MEIYLIRHTAVHNLGKLCYGQSDIALKDDWQKSFNALKENLGSKTEDAVFYSSPFERCTKLAQFLSDDKYVVDPNLSEMHFGDWEQKAWAEIDQAVLNLWMADYVNFRVPGGENFVNLYDRCAHFWDDLLLQTQPKSYILSHAGVIRSLLAYVLKIPLDKVFQLDIDYGAITKITTSGKGGQYQKVNYVNYQAADHNTKIQIS